MHKLFGVGVGLALLLFAATPSSTNYTLKTYDVGGSGGSSSSTNYKLNGTAGSQSGDNSSTNYGSDSGILGENNSNVPPAPTFTNPSNYYDKLKLVLSTGSNPSDTKYLIAISSDNFTTTNYVQADTSVGSSQAIANYQTYSAWGGASGFLILGLQPSTTYKVKVKALQGDFSGSAFGPTASASTINTTLTMSLATSLTATPPFSSDLTLTPGTVATATADALVGLDSNANSGGTLYVRSSNGGLTSTLAATTIASATTDLASASSGYGAQVASTGQTSGGPFSSASPFNVAGTNVGGLTTTFQPIVSSTAALVGGTTTVRLKAKAASTTPAATDYRDVVTFVIAMLF
jgi:hypothetical protein